MPFGSSEQSFTVNRVHLLKRLTDNRDRHILEYDKAVKNYRAALTKATAKQLKKLEQGKKFDRNFHAKYPEPRNFVESYNDAIETVKTVVGDTIDLTHRVHNEWVLDKWDWHNQFEVATMAYNHG